MLWANILTRLEGPRKSWWIWRFWRNLVKAVDEMLQANILTWLEGPRKKLANLARVTILAKFGQGCWRNVASKYINLTRRAPKKLANLARVAILAKFGQGCWRNVASEYIGCLPFVRINRWIMVRVFPKSTNQPNEMALTICTLISCNCFRLMRDWKLESLVNGKEISALPFRTEKEDYLWRYSTISERNFRKITLPFDFKPKFLDFLAKW